MWDNQFEKGDRVRLKHDHKATGSIDEEYEENQITMVSIVWDISGCVGDGPKEDVELIPEET